MRSFILSSVILCLITADICYGQKPGDQRVGELYLGVGGRSTNELLDGVRLNGEPTCSYRYERRSGTYCIGYRFPLTGRLGLSPSIAYENDAGCWGLINQADYANGTFKRQVFTVAADLYVTYVKERFFIFYGCFGLGYSYVNEVARYGDEYYYSSFNNGVTNLEHRQFGKDRFNPNVQIAPIGIAVGNRVCFFGELGFGYKGVARCGLLLKMSKRKTAIDGKKEDGNKKASAPANTSDHE